MNQVGSRCFGYAVPELSLVPFADSINHHTTDNQYELFNLKIGKKWKAGGKESLSEIEKYYATKDRQEIDYFACLPESMRGESGDAESKQMNKRSARYSRKV